MVFQFLYFTLLGSRLLRATLLGSQLLNAPWMESQVFYVTDKESRLFHGSNHSCYFSNIPFTNLSHDCMKVQNRSCLVRLRRSVDAHVYNLDIMSTQVLSLGETNQTRTHASKEPKLQQMGRNLGSSMYCQVLIFKWPPFVFERCRHFQPN